MIVVADRGDLRGQRSFAGLEPNFAIQIPLIRASVLVAHQLEHGQKHTYESRFVYRCLEEIRKRHPPVATHSRMYPRRISESPM